MAINVNAKGSFRIFQIYFAARNGLNVKHLMVKDGYLYRQYAKECKQLNTTQFKPNIRWRYNPKYAQFTFYVFDEDGSWASGMKCRQMFNEFMEAEGLNYEELKCYHSHFNKSRPERKVHTEEDVDK